MEYKCICYYLSIVLGWTLKSLKSPQEMLRAVLTDAFLTQTRTLLYSLTAQKWIFFVDNRYYHDKKTSICDRLNF